MPERKSSAEREMFRPFAHLEHLLRAKKITLKIALPPRCRPAADPVAELSPQEEEKLFKEAMADVTPLVVDHRYRPSIVRRRLTDTFFQDDEEKEAVEFLSRLIESGEGFTVADTGEYIEAAAPGVGPEITRSLHKGRYSIQDHIDLHGMTVSQAGDALHAFINRAISQDKKAVLVVHGRGLRSPGPPVLKNHVFLWLSRGILSKHVIALTSARACDGGAGATYVLLRRRPISRRMRKAASRQSY
jgi:DNA-nicking Smr family endonuclease